MIEDGTRLETIHRYCSGKERELSQSDPLHFALCSYGGVDNSRNLGDYITEIERDDDEGIPGGSTTILVLSSVGKSPSRANCRTMCVCVSRIVEADLHFIWTFFLTDKQCPISLAPGWTDVCLMLCM